MDLRWQLNKVINAIMHAFGINPQTTADLWLFHGAPSSTFEEPLHANMVLRDKQMTLKDLQRNPLYISTPSRKPLVLHFVELPFQPSQPMFDRGIFPVCVRFFDDMVREVGSVVVCVQHSGTVHDIIQEARRNAQLRDFNLSGPLRILEVADSRIHKNYSLDSPVRNLLCYNKYNFFYHCLRVEADVDVDARHTSTSEGHKLIEIFHYDRQRQQPFAQPFYLTVTPSEKVSSIKLRCKEKLNVPDAVFKSWRLVRIGCNSRIQLKNDDAWDVAASMGMTFCFEHSHPNPISVARQGRYNKPLTIM